METCPCTVPCTVCQRKNMRRFSSLLLSGLVVLQRLPWQTAIVALRAFCFVVFVTFYALPQILNSPQPMWFAAPKPGFRAGILFNVQGHADAVTHHHCVRGILLPIEVRDCPLEVKGWPLQVRDWTGRTWSIEVSCWDAQAKLIEVRHPTKEEVKGWTG